jgi:hypothetical protein
MSASIQPLQEFKCLGCQRGLADAVSDEAKQGLATSLRKGMLPKLDEIVKAGGGNYKLLPTNTGAASVTKYGKYVVLWYPVQEWTIWQTQWSALMQASSAYGAKFPLGDGVTVGAKVREIADKAAGMNPTSTVYQALVLSEELQLAGIPSVASARNVLSETLNTLYPKQGVEALPWGRIVGGVAVVGILGGAVLVAKKMAKHLPTPIVMRATFED